MTATTVTYTNPVIPGFAPDPSIVQVDGIFYLVNSSFHVFPGLPIYVSRDLREWTLIGHAINRPNQLNLEHATTLQMPLDTGHSMVATGGLFAPTIRHRNGTFYIICTNARFGPSDKMELDNFIVSTRDIFGGAWSDPIYIPLQGIDPDLFFDDDDRVYVQGSWQLDRTVQPSTTIKQYEIDLSTGKPLSKPREIWGGHARYDTEGPHIYKRGEWYYLLVAEGGTFEHHLLSIARSKSVTGPYESFAGNPILTADGKKEYIQNAGHGDLLSDINGRWWAVVLGVRDEPGWGLGRETFLTAVDWPEGGWPMIKQPQLTFQRNVINSNNNNGEKSLPVSSSITPSLKYVYIRNPDMSKYNFQNNQDVILRPSLEGLETAVGTCTFIGKRQRALEASATTTINVCSVCDGVRAGLALYKDHMRHASISYNGSASEVEYSITNSTTDLTQTTRYALETKLNKVHFKIETTAVRNVFYFRQTDDAMWRELGSYEVTELFAREMTGPLFGIFAQCNNNTVAGAGVTFSGLVYSDPDA